MSAAEVIWHDLECGSYAADLPVWLEVCADWTGPVLDVGAGTGRVTLPLARAGYELDALERSPALGDELARRSGGLPVRVLRGDACKFVSDRTYGLCIVPMQTVQLLADRAAFLVCAHAALAPAGGLAVALLGGGVEPFDAELEPDVLAVGGVRYLSRPTALRCEADAVVLERRRETRGEYSEQREDSVERLTLLDPDELENEARAQGFVAVDRISVAPTDQHAGSEIVVMRRTT
jgi:SAM-dependent methyltransferase